jgi:nitrite reductase/ring-hydroxylating ferredoxin subunit
MRHSGHSRQDEESPCAHCDAGHGRRQFLQEAALFVTSTIVAIGVGPLRAAAMPMGFVRALSTTGTEKVYPIPSADGVNIDVEESVIIARVQNVLYAFSLACPHQQTALKWFDDAREFRCPKHNSTFHADGVYIPDSGRATRGMDRFALRKDGANVAVDLDKLYQEDEDPAPWKAAVIRL